MQQTLSKSGPDRYRDTLLRCGTSRPRSRVRRREAFGVRGIPALSFSFLRYLRKYALVATAVAISLWSATVRADFNQTLADLTPRLAASPGADRYAARMELQAMAANASRPGADAERRALATVLAGRAVDRSVPQPARVWFIRQLELIGDGSAVTELAPLLFDQDPELKESARRALQRNSDPAASSVLLGALKRCSTPQDAIGFISSLGERRDADAVDSIARCLKAKETASVANSALGKIASDKAMDYLWRGFDAGEAAAADALITAGNRQLLAGHTKNAAKLFHRLCQQSRDRLPRQNEAKAGEGAQLHAAALIGLAKADAKLARPLIEPALLDPNPKLQNAATTAALTMFGEGGITRELAPLLPKLPASAKILVLRVLDASAEKQIIALAENDPGTTVRTAALERLGEVGTAASIPVLINTATHEPAELHNTARAALSRVSGPGVSDVLSHLAAQGDPETRVVAMAALSSRNDKTALPALLKYAAEEDPSIRRAACAALTHLGSDAEIEPLARLVLETGDSVAESALEHLASHASDKHGAAVKIATMMRSAPPRLQLRLYDTFTILGGPEALAVITSAIFASQEPDASERALRALANWQEFAATAPLLALAADTNTTRTHNVLAVQAVVRLVKSSEREPASARLDAARAAMNAARRDEEKKLVLSAYASVPSARAAEALKPFLKEALFQTEAALACLNLAGTLMASDKPAALDLARAVRDANISPDISRKAEEILKKH